MIRAFLAVELSQELRAEFATVQLGLKRTIEPEMKRAVRISWVQPASIHLTIKFLGDMNEQIIDPLLVAIGQSIGSQTAVSVPLERLGVFPHLRNPRVLWIGPSENWERGSEAKRVAEIRGAIEQACEGCNFLRETKSFSPHLTLARIREGGRYVGASLTQSGALDRPILLGSLAIKAVALVKSELRPTGSVYTKLWDVRLSGS